MVTRFQRLKRREDVYLGQRCSLREPLAPGERVVGLQPTLHAGGKKPKRVGALLFFEHKDERRDVKLNLPAVRGNAPSGRSPGASRPRRQIQRTARAVRFLHREVREENSNGGKHG